jgi:hypothetical protein
VISPAGSQQVAQLDVFGAAELRDLRQQQLRRGDRIGTRRVALVVRESAPLAAGVQRQVTVHFPDVAAAALDQVAFDRHRVDERVR